ncbi:dNA mismatch repair protein MutS [Coprobacillus sp. CAG:698]|nr:dNA mismatch repair protein MutS [Coprobacillus sp. CAG:698]
MYENIDKMQYSPMIRQYLTIKEKYPDVIVFFRLGDFYEMFFNDAIVASKELEIVLTGKDAGTEERVPMCGVPYHAVNSYLDKLTDRGYKVAIVEQTEDPANAKGIVSREVVRIVTPGTVTDGMNLEETDYNFISTVSFFKDKYVLAYCDITTGENYLTNLPPSDDILIAELLKLKTKEIVISSTTNKNVFTQIQGVVPLTISIHDDVSEIDYMSKIVEDLDKDEKETFLRLLNYIVLTQKRVLVHMQKVVKYSIKGFMKIDLSSRRNLEILETLRFQNKKNTLLSVLDKCSTAMGSRYLKKNLMFPLVDKELIEKRYDIINKMLKKFIEVSELRSKLEVIYDLERIVGKISYESANPKDLLHLRNSLQVLPEIINLVTKIKINDYFDLKNNIDEFKALYNLLNSSISDDAPFSAKDRGIIKKGYNQELDELNDMNLSGKDYLIDFEAKEKERTGIKNLKIGYNRVFGYFIEIPNGSKNLVKEEFGYVRKQTISTAERYITQELKEKESLILRAEEKASELEYQLFTKIREEAKKYADSLQNLARIISELDMMQSFAKVSNENKYVRPILNNENIIDIKNGRHPVIELTIDNYVPNDVKMNDDDFILLITGPNMSGKSTYMRELALIAIMAQIGCYVPASSASLPVFDAIYTRIGAADDIVSGQSTFMVEMNEVNNALSFATKSSLILFDEIGRGTATYDGMALAQAIIEYIHENIKCKTLFSTHYHELTILEQDLPGLKNVHVSAEEINGDIVFMHKVLKGSVDQSYGINVAKLANIPLDVILRAKDILYKLESNEKKGIDLSLSNYQAPLLYDSKTEKETFVLDSIKNANIYAMNPLEAMNLLSDLQKKLK